MSGPNGFEAIFLGVLEGEGQLLGAGRLSLALGEDEPDADVDLVAVLHSEQTRLDLKLSFLINFYFL